MKFTRGYQNQLLYYDSTFEESISVSKHHIDFYLSLQFDTINQEIFLKLKN